MKANAAELFLQCHRPGGRDDSVVQKAVRFAENEPALGRKLREQTEFDEQVMGVVHAIQPPDDLKRRLAACDALSAAAARPRPQFTIAIALTMGCGLLLIIGLLVTMEMDHLAHFPGREAAERMIDTANSMSGIELEPVSSMATGQLGDWFYMHGFENYVPPEEFAPLPAIGVRVLRIDGKLVAQVAVDQHECILYMFRASDFDNDIPQKSEWLVFDHDDWAAALRRRDDVCVLIMFRGSKDDMRKYLQKLHPT